VKEGKNLRELADRLAPFMLRRTKKQVLKDYKDPLLGELKLDAGKATAMLDKAELEPQGVLMREALRRGGLEALEELAPELSTLRRLIGNLKVLPVLEWLLDQRASGMSKIVIVCYHTEVIEALHDKLLAEGVETVCYQGGMTPKQKDAAKADFIRKPHIFGLLLQINAGGTGVDGVQAATGDMILVEHSWIADDNKQVIGRLDRIGQENPVIARFACLQGSLDDAITAVARKRAAEKDELFG
jgi:SNF2 family DNA or RNA helicase